MAQCRECKQTYQHKMSCSRSKSHGRRYVESQDEVASNWPAGSFDSPGNSIWDTPDISPSYDSGSSSCSSSSSDSGSSCGGGGE